MVNFRWVVFWDERDIVVEVVVRKDNFIFSSANKGKLKVVIIVLIFKWKCIFLSDYRR